MALTKADGTALSKTPGGTVLGSVSDADPAIEVLIDVYRLTPYPGVNFPDVERQKLFRAGQVIRQSQWDAEFVAPVVTSISPATGAAAGGTAITITGAAADGNQTVRGAFSQDATVTVDAVAATSVVVVDANTITCVTPAGSAGAVDVVVTQSSGVATVTDGFTYTA